MIMKIRKQLATLLVGKQGNVPLKNNFQKEVIKELFEVVDKSIEHLKSPKVKLTNPIIAAYIEAVINECRVIIFKKLARNKAILIKIIQLPEEYYSNSALAARLISKILCSNNIYKSRDDIDSIITEIVKDYHREQKKLNLDTNSNLLKERLSG